jgi:hypothetical protein
MSKKVEVKSEDVKVENKQKAHLDAYFAAINKKIKESKVVYKPKAKAKKAAEDVEAAVKK